MTMPMTKQELDKLKNPAETRAGFEISFEVRSSDNPDEETMVLEGYALKFNNQTLIGSEKYGFREIILPGALDNTNMKKVPLKYNHEGSYLLLASTKNDSLKLTVDDIGLKFEATLIPTSSNRDVYLSVKEKLLSECSFAFTISPDEGQEWDWSQDIPLRKIKKIDRLFDVAIVDIPAYEQTSVGARNILASFENERKAFENEKELKEKKQLTLLMKIKLGGVSK